MRGSNGGSRREGWTRWHRGKEGAIRALLFLCALSALGVIVATLAVFVYESVLFFRKVPLSEFLGRTRWAPIHEPASYGILPLLGATLVITAIALGVAAPLGFLAAVFLAAYAPPRLRALLKPAVEMLAGVPTVVYGFFALRFVTPFLQRFLPVGFWNGLSAGLVMGVMITPYMASLSDDVLYAVPRSLWEAGYALGARRPTVLLRVVVPAALSGIGAAFILALTRAVGETMIVALAAGRTPAWPPNPLQPLLPLTTALVNIATGDHEAGALIWSHLFSIGLLLFLLTFTLNVLSYRVLRKFRGRAA